MLLLYIRAAFGLLFGSTVFAIFFGLLIHLLASVAMVAGGLGIANERRWGYRLAVGVTVLGLVPIVVWMLDSPGVMGEFWFMTLALFQAAQLVLLLHPMSRQHQRIWFT